MPTYPAVKTFRGGFYNNKKVNGNDDRVYTAEDIRKPYDTIFTDGIQPDADGTAGETLKVTSLGGFGISVGVGNAKLGGAWFENTGAYNIGLDTASNTTRYDCVIIRNDDSDAVREPSIYIKSLNVVPTAADLIRTGEIYEICIAYVIVPALASNITNANIVDTREHGTLCNVMSGVGAMVVRSFHNTYYSERAGQTTIPIGIEQYNHTRDILTVAVEGRIFAEGVNYRVVDNENIELIIGLPVVGTKVDFEVTRNVNGKGAETVVQEVAQLQKDVKAINDKLDLEHHYYCNGINDNIGIGDLVRSFYNNYNENRRVHLYVHGFFGVGSFAAGNGTASNPHCWFDFSSTVKPCRVTVDFSDCSRIILPVSDYTVNTIFKGDWIDIVGANINANNVLTTTVRVFATQNENAYVFVDDCRFEVFGQRDCSISYLGRFTNCYGRVINATGDLSWCFPVRKHLHLIGGEYLAYYGSGVTSAVVYLEDTYTNSAVMHGVSCPSVSLSGYDQSWSGYADPTRENFLVSIGTITKNPFYINDDIIDEDGANTRTIIGTIPLNVSGVV